jgi:ribose transport system ATP-binding protein
MDENKTLLEAKGISKQFSGIWVLKNVNLSVKHGEVHALMGENGAGKSTIIKIITGIHSKDAGEISIDNVPVKINSRQDARKNGIAVIYQELSLIPDLTIAENIHLGQEVTKHGLLQSKVMNSEVQRLIDKYGFSLKPTTLINSLSMAQRQMAEILKALSMDAKLIIMDEPTASLSTAETEKLFETIERLKKQGTAILYISHRLEEVNRIADRLTVMRDGENVGILEKKDINPVTVTKMMIGREVKQNVAYAPKINPEMCLEVNRLSYGMLFSDVSFKAFGGEILGIGGLVGSGRTEIIRCIYGALKQKAGTILLNGKPVSRSILKNIRAGFGFVPEDRRSEGFIPMLSIERNIILPSLKILSKLGFSNRRKESAYAETAIRDYDVRPTLRQLPVSNLSGGNQQKVVIGKWLSRKPTVLLLDEPTAGVDVGVKADLYSLIRNLADSGGIVIMVSSDLVELTHLSDRILVLYNGRFFEEFPDHRATQEAVLLASSGVHTEEGTAL